MEWRQCAESHYYEVSENGDVRRKETGHVLKSMTDRYGYINYCLATDGQKKTVRAHRLVAKSFLPAKPDGKYEIAHTDGNKSNNHYSNLRWATKAENERDKTLHGSRRVKFSDQQISRLRAIYAKEKPTIKSLAKSFGMNPMYCSQILKGELRA